MFFLLFREMRIITCITLPCVILRNEETKNLKTNTFM